MIKVSECDNCKNLMHIECGLNKIKGCIYGGNVPVANITKCSHFEEKQ